MTRKELLKQEICNLTSKLTCASSPIGDWKVAKCMEYQLAGLESPYDIATLHAERQAVRDKINQLQEELNTLADEM